MKQFKFVVSCSTPTPSGVRIFDFEGLAKLIEKYLNLEWELSGELTFIPSVNTLVQGMIKETEEK